MADEKMRYAVVTGANKGIGFEICRQLAEKGIKVVLTARDEKRGLAAVEKLGSSGLSDFVVFHQLDVADPATVTALVDFVKTQFGKLDILELLKREAMTQTYELAKECLQINYYGAKRTTEAFLPLLQLSDAPRIVNVSSRAGKLQLIPNEWARGVLSDAENLSEEKVDMVLSEFMKDFKEGSIENKGWPVLLSAYHLSKAAVNAYTRILAKRYPSFIINCVCPGYVKTDNNCNTGILTVEEGAESPVKLAVLPNGGPSGLFFDRKEVSSF